MMKWCTHDCQVGTADCADIFIDVNGFKPPNTVGKDIFGIRVSDTRVMPYGTAGDEFVGTCVATGTGYGCSAEDLYK